MADHRMQLRCPTGIWLAVILASSSGRVALGQTPSAAAAEEHVVQVRVVGHDRVPLQKILPNIHTRAGRVYNPETVEEDVRRLNNTRLFVTVKPYTQQTPAGRLVIFEVYERPIVGYVKYVGNRKIAKKTLQEESLVKEGEALDVFSIEESRRRIEEYYHTHGFPKAQVTLAEGSRPEDRGVIFLVNEGTKQRVWSTRFVGNTIATDARLKTQVLSKPGVFWIFNGDVHLKQIDEDVHRLTAYYRSLGFFRARIGREMEFDEDREWLTLTFVIDEGPRYSVRNVSFIGNTKFSTERLAQDLKLRSGQYFRQAEMLGDVAAIRDIYGSVGYVFADVKADPRFLEQPGQLDLVYNIEEGERYRVGRIDVQIKGEYAHTKINTVLNRMSLKPGDIVDTRELRASERRLKASGLFAVDPARGVSPKIVFSPPSAADLETNVARQPDRPAGFRGQSPDDSSAQDQWIGLAVQGELLDEQPPAEPPAEQLPSQQVSPPASSPSPQLPLPPQFRQPGQEPMLIRGQSPSRAAPWRAVRPIAAAATEVGTNRPASPVPQDPLLFPWQPSGQGSLVMRGQYSGGVSIPQFNPNAGRVQGFAPQVQQDFRQATPPATGVQQPIAPVSPMDPAAPQTLPPAMPAPLAPPQGVQPAPNPLYAPAFPPGGIVPPNQSSIFREDPSATNLLGRSPDQDPLYLPLNPVLEETQTGRLMFSVGVNSEAGVIGSVVIDEQNFDWTRFPRGWEDIRNATAWRGAGQRFRIEAVPGTEVQKYTVNFQEPYLLDTPVSLSLSGYYYDRRYREWDEQRTGGRVGLGYQFTPDLSGVVAFRGANVKIFDPIASIPELDEVLGSNALYGFEVRLVHDTRDSAFLPTEGHLFQISAEQVIGSFEYPRGEIEFRQYFMLRQRPDGSGRHVLSVGGKVAVSGEDTPIYEHYFAGGFTTIRGFDFREASPRNMGIIVGGEFMALASAEYMFPITADDALRGVVFVDTGTVEPTIDNWTDTYRVAPGFGLRITVPAMGPAPIALDLAFPISREDGDDIQNFSFFVGFLR